MTGLLEEAIKKVEALPPEGQDQIANQILESLKDEESWDLFCARNIETIRAMAEQARHSRIRNSAATNPEC